MRILLALLGCLCFTTSVSGQVWGDNVRQAERPKALCWSSSDAGPLFVAATQPKLKDALNYDGGDFSLRLTATLSYDRASDYFSFWAGTGLVEQLIWLRRTAGAYRGKLAGGRDVGLNDLGKLKVVWVSSGESFLFTEVNGAWRCVSMEDPRGRKIFIDYDRAGTVVLVRGLNRTLEPVYREGQLVRVYQSWPLRSGGRGLAMLAVGGE